MLGRELYTYYLVSHLNHRSLGIGVKLNPNPARSVVRHDPLMSFKPPPSVLCVFPGPILGYRVFNEPVVKMFVVMMMVACHLDRWGFNGLLTCLFPPISYLSSKHTALYDASNSKDPEIHHRDQTLYPIINLTITFSSIF